MLVQDFKKCQKFQKILKSVQKLEFGSIFHFLRNRVDLEQFQTTGRSLSKEFAPFKSKILHKDTLKYLKTELTLFKKNYHLMSRMDLLQDAETDQIHTQTPENDSNCLVVAQGCSLSIAEIEYLALKSSSSKFRLF